MAKAATADDAGGTLASRFGELPLTMAVTAADGMSPGILYGCYALDIFRMWN